MLNMTQKSNRRKHPRYSPKNYTFIADLKTGVIIDLSLGGMAFYYADRKPWPKAVLQNVTLQCKENGHLIRNLPVETISDFKLPNNFKKGAMVIHRRSVRFGRLTATQNEQLDKLIAMAANTGNM